MRIRSLRSSSGTFMMKRLLNFKKKLEFNFALRILIKTILIFFYLHKSLSTLSGIVNLSSDCLFVIFLFFSLVFSNYY